MMPDLLISIVGPPQSGKTTFLSSLAHTHKNFIEPRPSQVYSCFPEIAHYRSLSQSRQLFQQFLQDHLIPSVSTEIFSAQYNRRLISFVDAGPSEWSTPTLFSDYCLENATGVYLLLPAPVLKTADTETLEQFKKEVFLFLQKLQLIKSSQQFLLFIVLSRVDLLPSGDLGTSESYPLLADKEIQTLLKSFDTRYSFFSARESFTYGHGTRPFDCVRDSFLELYHYDQKKKRRKTQQKILLSVLSIALIFFVYLLGFAFYQRGQILQNIKRLQPLLAQSSEMQHDYQKQVLLFHQEKYSFWLFQQILPLETWEKNLELFKQALFQELSQLPAYSENPKQMNYSPRDYEKALQWIETLTFYSTGDPYGKLLLEKKQEAALLKQKLPDISTWGRLYNEIEELLNRTPSRELKQFQETVVLPELTWALENTWEQSFQARPFSARYFQRNDHFLETQRDFIPPTLRTKFLRQLETSWSDAFTECQQKSTQARSNEERFKIFETLYRDPEGEVIPEADKYMPAELRYKLKQEVTKILHSWPNEKAGKSWDQWFGGGVERKIEQIKLIYSGKENITSQEEWTRFLNTIQELTNKLLMEVPAEDNIYAPLKELQQFVDQLKKEIPVQVTCALTLPSSIHSFYNVFVPQVSLLIQKSSEQKRFGFENPNSSLSISWTPGEAIQIQVQDIKYPHHNDLQLEQPSLNPFLLTQKKRYQQSEEIYIDLRFEFEKDLIDLGKKVDFFWQKK